MDPNANLEEQRRLIHAIFADETSSTNYDALMRLAELSQALDEWLCNGGFLPTAWKQKG
jgi:hypothetical protein